MFTRYLLRLVPFRDPSAITQRGCIIRQSPKINALGHLALTGSSPTLIFTFWRVGIEVFDIQGLVNASFLSNLKKLSFSVMFASIDLSLLADFLNLKALELGLSWPWRGFEVVESLTNWTTYSS